jgi:hypothetical protein
VKIPLGISKRRWEHNIEMDLKETQCKGEKFIEFIQDKV